MIGNQCPICCVYNDSHQGCEHTYEEKFAHLAFYAGYVRVKTSERGAVTPVPFMAEPCPRGAQTERAVLFTAMIIVGGPVPRSILQEGRTTLLGMEGGQQFAPVFGFVDDVLPSEGVHLPSLQTGLYHHPSRTFLAAAGDPEMVSRALSGILVQD